MGSNQASIARRQRERERKQKQAEKAAQKAERREHKKSPSGAGESPMDDPTIDWSFAVRETKIEDPEPAEEPEVEGEAP